LDSYLINYFKLYVLSNVNHLVIAWRLYVVYTTPVYRWVCSMEIELVAAGTVRAISPIVSTHTA